MSLSRKKRDAAYAVIHHTVTDVRIALKLLPKQDVELAQIEHVLWSRLLQVLAPSPAQEQEPT